MIQIEISLSSGKKSEIDAPEFSGKTGDGTRLPMQEYDGDLRKETVEEFKHRKKKRNKKPRRSLALPHQGTTQNQYSGSPRDVGVTKENWLGRLERDSAPPRRRITIGGPKGTL